MSRTLPARRPEAARPSLTGSRMGASLRAEWTKLRTVPGTIWSLLAGVALTVALGVAADAATRCPAGGCRIDPARTGLTGIYLGQAVMVVLGASSMGGEYGTGMIRLTLTAMPRRATVLAAKAAALTGPVLLTGAIAVAGSVLAGRLILPGHGLSGPHGHPPLSPGDGPVLRAAAGSVLYLALIALLGLGVAAVVRDTAAAIGIVLAVLYILPIVTTVVRSPTWHRHLEQIAPMTAGLTVQDTTGLRDLPVGPWTGLGVAAAWAAGALLLGGLLLRLRDA